MSRWLGFSTRSEAHEDGNVFMHHESSDSDREGADFVAGQRKNHRRKSSDGTALASTDGSRRSSQTSASNHFFEVSVANENSGTGLAKSGPRLGTSSARRPAHRSNGEGGLRDIAFAVSSLMLERNTESDFEETNGISNSGIHDDGALLKPIRTSSPSLAGPGEDLEDWEEITAESMMEGLEPSQEESKSEIEFETKRPLSPGVDFSKSDGKSFSSVGITRCKDEGAQGITTGGAIKDDGYEGSKWADARESHSFLVRGPTYLTDKGKRPAGAAMCRLVAFDCFAHSSSGVTRIDHIASRGSCREKVAALTSGRDASFLFIMNIQVRGNPPVSMVAYWAISREALANPDTVKDTQERTFAKIVASYADIPLSEFGGADRSCGLMDETSPPPHSDERNKRFKLIPRVIGGPWMVRKAVGSTPVLLGTKIYHRYYRGEHYMETDMDTGSSTAAASLCGRCRGLSRNLDVDLGIVLQANSPEELPEVLLGAVRLNGFGVEDPALQTKLFP